MANGDMAGVENRLTAIADAITAGGGAGSGTVTDVSVVTANGVSGSVATSTTTPAITLTLGAITPSTVTIGAGAAITSSGAGGALGTAAFTAATAYEVAGAAAAVISDTAYDATSWDGDTTHAPSKNAVRDKIESLSFAADDTPYDATTWNGSTLAPTQNSVRDKFETLRIGTDVQAYDAQLDTWAGVTPGTGVTDFLATPTLANFNTALSDADVATLTGTETLSGKTLTEPKFADLGFIADANGNELLVLDTVASAVNELKLANAAATGSPTLSATGGDTNISIALTPKGSGGVILTSGITSKNPSSTGNGFIVGTTTNGEFYGASSGIWIRGNSGSSSLFLGGTDTVRFGIGGDTALSKSAAGVIEVNSGTPGTSRELKARSVKHDGVTIANLPGSPSIGQVAAVTDGDASLAWGDTAVNSGAGATKYLVWYNGAAWTVVGK